MAKGQGTLELLLGYSIAFIIIAATLAILFIFYPNIFATASSSTYSGFAGLVVAGQGYCNSGCNATGFYYIRFQNLLSENINVTRITFLSPGIDQNFSDCYSSIENRTVIKNSALPDLYIPNLGYAECNFTMLLSSPYSASVDIYYVPSNDSYLISEPIEIAGSVSG